MYKLSTFLAEGDYGYAAVPLFGPADPVFEKQASVSLLPEVLQYIANLKPLSGCQYVLVNAMGAGEYYSSNINGDWFEESGLVHTPQGWTGNPLVDRALGKGWTYGYPTFYNAYPFAHHRNGDPSRAYGEVELAVWNEGMKRVELVCRVDYDKCVKFGGVPVWDKLKMGQFADVSMGCFLAGTLVTMADGTRKNIEDVQVGERVLTHRGRPRRVLATQRHVHKGAAFCIKPEAHPSFTCTSEHPLYCAMSDQVRHTDQSQRRWVEPSTVALSPEWVPARELDDHDLIEPVLQGVLSPDYATREFCRLLGYYIAEGHILRGKDGAPVGIQLSTHRDDAVHDEIADLCAAVGTSNPPSWLDSASSEYSKNIYVFDSWLARKFEELSGTGAKTKRLAEEVLHWHPMLQAELIGAYANGDGCYGGKGSLNLSSANRDLMFQWLTILPRLGVAASLAGLTHKEGTGFSRTNTREWVLHIGKQYVFPFIGKCAKVHPEPLLRSNNMRLFFGEHLVTPVRRVEELELDAEVFNLEVEEDNSYLIGNLAVHNSKVCYDLSSITTDWELYQKALKTFDPKKYAYPGLAVVEFHKKLKAKDGVGIRGLSITRNDYDEWTKNHMNRILPDGRKVFVYNPYPRFFDISFVFIGADRTAKVMVFIVRHGDTRYVPSAEAGEKVAAAHYTGEMNTDVSTKFASVSNDLLKKAFGFKGAEDKKGEIDKEVIPSQFAGKAVPLVAKSEKDLPEWAIRALSSVPEEKALSTTSSMGIVLKPREFQRIVLIRMGKRDLSNELAEAGKVFPKVEEITPCSMSSGSFMPALARLLMPLLSERSALGPFIERRIIITQNSGDETPTSHSSEELRKISAAYNGYRRALMDIVASTQDLLPTAAPADVEVTKLAATSPELLFTPLAVAYFKEAHLDELSFVDKATEVLEKNNQSASVKRVLPSRNT